MGAYLYFRTESDVDRVTNYLFNENKLNMFLEKMDEQTIWLCDSEHLKWVEENRPDMMSWELGKFGKGSLKTSTDMSPKMVEAGYSQDDLAEMWVQIFEELNGQFKMKYYAHSCSLNPDSAYFTIAQMKRITNNGKLLSGKTSKSERAKELYDKYFKLFSEPEKEVFDISVVKVGDKLLMDDNIWYTVTQSSGKLKFAWESPDKKYNYREIEGIAESIQNYMKYVPSIYYHGAQCDVEAYVKNNNTLLYLEVIGQEAYVKSILSVLMQGRLSMDGYTVGADFSIPSINKAGNKRLIVNLGDGIAHAILYHSPSISDVNFNVLIGENEKKLLTSFDSWLEKSQPLPYPKEFSKQIFEKLKDRGAISELTTFGIKAVEVNLDILADEFSDLREVILEVCKENGLIPENAKPIREQAPLPKSSYLTKKQVKKIFDTLNSMPKTYELENKDIKPVGLKLFSPGMTLYITEADAGRDEDEFENMHTQCYGYVKNESYPQMSEWGYINVREYLEVEIPVRGNIPGFKVGFEQDLYFEDMYIDSKGNVGTLDELTQKQSINEITCPSCGSKQIEISETIDGFHWCSCIDCNKIFKKPCIKQVA